MDFTFTPKQEAFRQEIRTFLRERLPDGGPGWNGENEFEFARTFLKQLAPKRWIAPVWPEEYGGLGLGLWEQVVFNEEMSYRGAPSSNLSAVGYLGPTIMMYGTEEQKRQHLPGITSGEVFWCQGYSEPEAGSDLASLQTRAVADGDDFIISGQKIWTSQAHYSDWIFLLARTDPDAPKHKGISYFLLDMKSPGITVRPLINMGNQAGFNEVFFDNVRVPRSGLLGELNRGWYMATTTLDMERSSVAGSSGSRRSLEELTAFARETKVNGGRLQDLPLVRNKLAELWIELNISKFLSYRVVTLQERGLMPNHEASIVKVFNSEYGQRLSRAGLHMLGLYGQLHPESPYARLRGRFERWYLISAAITIAAGTSEIQRNIIATRGLGLPRN
ncbi:MAG: acyl-CoA dehydrogenase family protein [Chloroflexi bacterium]|nr:acyl-CoA dehydrogenase family protein [Chloroflexota bacterium]